LHVFRAIVPLILAVAAPAMASSPGLSVDSWWERITITMTHDGQAQGCRYEASTASAGAKDCKVVGANGAAVTGAKDQYATVTFERRFNPGGSPPAESAMQPGDKLLGRQVMALAIDGAGKVSGCKVIAATGETGLTYGCEDVAAEQFATSTSAMAESRRQGFMTILVYGHTEHVV
jgi:hypothetical protein